MENDILFAVLKKCYDKGLYNSVDITPEFRIIIERDLSTSGTPYDLSGFPNLIFGDLKEKGYINYLVDYLKPFEASPVTENMTDLIRIAASITPKGILFYNDWNQIIVQQKANKRSYVNICITAGIAIATFITVIYQKVVDKINDHSKQDTEILRRQVSQQNKELKRLREQLNQEPYPSGSSHTP